jgi:hypothetical protein
MHALKISVDVDRVNVVKIEESEVGEVLGS